MITKSIHVLQMSGLMLSNTVLPWPSPFGPRGCFPFRLIVFSFGIILCLFVLLWQLPSLHIWLSPRFFLPTRRTTWTANSPKRAAFWTRASPQLRVEGDRGTKPPPSEIERYEASRTEIRVDLAGFPDHQRACVRCQRNITKTAVRSDDADLHTRHLTDDECAYEF